MCAEAVDTKLIATVERAIEELYDAGGEAYELCYKRKDGRYTYLTIIQQSNV